MRTEVINNLNELYILAYREELKNKMVEFFHKLFNGQEKEAEKICIDIAVIQGVIKTLEGKNKIKGDI